MIHHIPMSSLLLACNKGLVLGRLVTLARTCARSAVEELSAATGIELLANVLDRDLIHEDEDPSQIRTFDPSLR